MSIELEVDLPQPVALWQLLPKASVVLADLLGLAAALPLTLETMHDGVRKPVPSDELREGAYFVVSIAGEPETVEVQAGSEAAYLSMGSQRTALEYVLGAALAVAIAREVSGRIGDGWHHFWKGGGWRTAAELLQHLRVEGSSSDYREASERVRVKQRWGYWREGD